MRPDPLDRRQRVAAAVLLSAIDLPHPVEEVARLALAAADVCPGINVVEAMFGQGRKACLERARDLIEEMLAELNSDAS